MQEQKNRSRAASEVSTDDWKILYEDEMQKNLLVTILKRKSKNHKNS